MELTQPMGAEFRAVRDGEHDGKPARFVEGSRLYPTSVEDLWDAVTSAERLERWFLPIRGDLEVGARYQLEGNAGGTITRCDPPEAFDVTWEYGGNVSWVSVRLTPDDGGARLTLVHTIPRDDAAEQFWSTYGPGAGGVGWDSSFLGLGLYLDSGEPVEREATEAWLATAAGKDFLRECAAGWADAHAAAGEDRRVADEMAARTAAFYTGE